MTSDGEMAKTSNSLASSTPGELLILDSRGNVLSRKQQAAMRWQTIATTAGVSLSAGVLAGVIVGSPLVGVCVAAGFAVSYASQQGHYKRFRRVMHALASGDLDKADDAVAELEAKRLPNALVPRLAGVKGSLAWRRGDLDGARSYFQQAVILLSSKKNFKQDAMYWLWKFELCEIAIISGERAVVKELKQELQDAPAGDFFALSRASVALFDAFYSQKPKALPDDETLYDWAKLALGLSRFGILLVLLGWAFAERGDDDMASHVLAEAPERLEDEYLEQVAPDLHQWWQTKAKKLDLI